MHCQELVNVSIHSKCMYRHCYRGTDFVSNLAYFFSNANAPNDIISAISNLRDIVSENNSAKSLLKLHTFIAVKSFRVLERSIT